MLFRAIVSFLPLNHGQKDFPTWKSTSMIATVTCKLPRVLLVSSRVPVVVKFIKYENRHTVFKAQECVKRGVWWCMLVWSNVLSSPGDQGWHQCWVTGQCLGLKLRQITVSESYRHETCLKHKENHMLPWLLETCFPCLLGCANNRGNFLELLFWRFFHQSTEMLVIILLSEGLKLASLTPFRCDSWGWCIWSGLREATAD